MIGGKNCQQTHSESLISSEKLKPIIQTRTLFKMKQGKASVPENKYTDYDCPGQNRRYGLPVL